MKTSKTRSSNNNNNKKWRTQWYGKKKSAGGAAPAGVAAAFDDSGEPDRWPVDIMHDMPHVVEVARSSPPQPPAGATATSTAATSPSTPLHEPLAPPTVGSKRPRTLSPPRRKEKRARTAASVSHTVAAMRYPSLVTDRASATSPTTADDAWLFSLPCSPPASSASTTTVNAAGPRTPITSPPRAHSVLSEPLPPTTSVATSSSSSSSSLHARSLSRVARRRSFIDDDDDNDHANDDNELPLAPESPGDTTRHAIDASSPYQPPPSHTRDVPATATATATTSTTIGSAPIIASWLFSAMARRVATLPPQPLPGARAVPMHSSPTHSPVQLTTPPSSTSPSSSSSSAAPVPTSQTHIAEQQPQRDPHLNEDDEEDDAAAETLEPHESCSLASVDDDDEHDEQAEEEHSRSSSPPAHHQQHDHEQPQQHQPHSLGNFKDALLRDSQASTATPPQVLVPSTPVPTTTTFKPRRFDLLSKAAKLGASDEVRERARIKKERAAQARPQPSSPPSPAVLSPEFSPSPPSSIVGAEDTSKQELSAAAASTTKPGAKVASVSLVLDDDSDDNGGSDESSDDGFVELKPKLKHRKNLQSRSSSSAKSLSTKGPSAPPAAAEAATTKSQAKQKQQVKTRKKPPAPHEDPPDSKRKQPIPPAAAATAAPSNQLDLTYSQGDEEAHKPVARTPLRRTSTSGKAPAALPAAAIECNDEQSSAFSSSCKLEFELKSASLFTIRQLRVSSTSHTKRRRSGGAATSNASTSALDLGAECLDALSHPAIVRVLESSVPGAVRGTPFCIVLPHSLALSLTHIPLRMYRRGKQRVGVPAR